MKLNFTFDAAVKSDVYVMAAFKKVSDKETSVQLDWKDTELKKAIKEVKSFGLYEANTSEMFTFQNAKGVDVLVLGLGEKKNANAETIRKAIANAFKALECKKYKSAVINLDTFGGATAVNAEAMLESLWMSQYKFTKYKSQKSTSVLKSLQILSAEKAKRKTLEKLAGKVENLGTSIGVARDFVNEPPNVLHSVEYAKRVEKDVKTNLKGKSVKVKILGSAEMKKEKMGCFLSVNAGSAHDARLVHLTYTPKRTTKNTKHYALVGKGLTFDTGGYSLKPGGSMMNMKFDMAGSATVYGAFRAAVLNDSPYKITCILGMTDNAVSPNATMPDTIVTAKNGKTVEILNTDAEGRLVLADCLSYASDLKPNYIIDAATLTGACLIALGSQVCAILGNDQKFINTIKTNADKSDEYAWQLPIIDEWREDMKSQIADLKNIGTAGRAGTATAAAFLENFVGEGISWAHLDVAGVADSQTHLPYCPTKGGSGIMIRTLARLLS